MRFIAINSFKLCLAGLLAGAGFSQVPSPRPHPGYDNIDINPGFMANNNRGYGGLAWLEDGRMVALEYGGNNGKVHLFTGVLTANSGSDIESEEIETGLHEPLGTEVVDGVIYINEKTEFTKLEPNGGGWNYSTEYDAHDPWEQREFYHWFSMGLIFHNAKFYWSLGGFTQYGQFEDELPERHGTVVEYDPGTGTHEFLVHGLRNTGGIGVGPEGTICTNDNQGEWLPANKFVCFAESRPDADRWYGWDGPDALMRNGRDASPPTVWNTYKNNNSPSGMGNSPGEVILLPKGPYKGQMLMADCNDAWLSRLFLEKVDGYWQGANFRFTGGFTSGTWRLLLAPDSLTLIVGGIGGNGGGWAYPDTSNGNQNTYTALHRLEPNGTDVFDILAIRSLGPDEMEVEFTLPANAAAGQAGNYDVSSWQNVPSGGYGAGHQQDEQNHNVTAVELSSDGTKAVLSINGLEEGRVVRIDVNDNNVQSAEGDDLWYHWGDYTLNAFGPADPVGVKSVHYVAPEIDYSLESVTKGYRLKFNQAGTYHVSLKDLRGRLVMEDPKVDQGSLLIKKESMPNGVYFLNIHNGIHSVSGKITLY